MDEWMNGWMSEPNCVQLCAVAPIQILQYAMYAYVAELLRVETTESSTLERASRLYALCQPRTSNRSMPRSIRVALELVCMRIVNTYCMCHTEHHHLLLQYRGICVPGTVVRIQCERPICIRMNYSYICLNMNMDHMNGTTVHEIVQYVNQTTCSELWIHVLMHIFEHKYLYSSTRWYKTLRYRGCIHTRSVQAHVLEYCMSYLYQGHAENLLNNI